MPLSVAPMTVTERQFLRSMIPHHGGAILMCQQLKSSDQQIRRLCGEIESSQQSEIVLMQAMLEGRPSPATADR